MGFFGKLFGKKDDFDFKPPKDSDLGLDFGKDDMGAGLGGTPDLGGMPSPKEQQPLPTLEPVQEQGPFSQQQSQPLPGSHPGFQQSQPMQDPNYILSKNLEVISSKLDALHASLESINQRLINLERVAHGEQEHSKKYRW